MYLFKENKQLISQNLWWLLQNYVFGIKAQLCIEKTFYSKQDFKN
jgi:hypothetical protein